MAVLNSTLWNCNALKPTSSSSARAAASTSAPATGAVKPKLMSLIIETAAGQKKRELTGFEHNPAASQKLPPKKLKLGPATCDGCCDDAR